MRVKIEVDKDPSPITLPIIKYLKKSIKKQEKDREEREVFLYMLLIGYRILVSFFQFL